MSRGWIFSWSASQGWIVMAFCADSRILPPVASDTLTMYMPAETERPLEDRPFQMISFACDFAGTSVFDQIVRPCKSEMESVTFSAARASGRNTKVNGLAAPETRMTGEPGRMPVEVIVTGAEFGPWPALFTA